MRSGAGACSGRWWPAAVILEPGYRIKGLRDSKLIDRETRETLAERIKQHAIAYAVAAVDVARIDQLNIYWASLLAMREAVAQLAPAPDHLLVDAVRVNWECPQTNIIHGDALSISIAAASIIAKVHRDEMIRRWAPVYPQYDLASNKGYRSPKHLAALKELGPTPLHRLSFAPVWMCLEAQQEEFEWEEKRLVVSTWNWNKTRLAAGLVRGLGFHSLGGCENFSRSRSSMPRMVFISTRGKAEQQKSEVL